MMRRLTPLFIIMGLWVSSAVAQADFTPMFEYDECPFELPEGEVAGETIDCGYLTVPETRGDPDSPTIDLAVAILYSLDENPESDPVVYLEGGPGGSALAGIDTWLNVSLLDNRDLILIDQRGTGYSLPSLTCYEIEEAEEDIDMQAAARACKDRLVAAGIDLSAYNSAASAADIADLRVALGIDEWNVFGISYGTRLALTLMRDHPQGIRSVILDSVYPPEVDGYAESGPIMVSAFDVLFKGCAADPQCDAAFPKLDRVFYETVSNLNANPVTYTAFDPDTGEEYDTYLDGEGLVNAIFDAQYDAFLIPYLPLVIYEVAEGNYSIVHDLESGTLLAPSSETDDDYPEDDDFDEDVSDSEGMYNSVECSEEIPFNDLSLGLGLLQDTPQSVRGQLIAELQTMYDTCQIWDVQPAAAIETQPVQSDIPTLILAGEYDPVTPPAWAAKAAEHLPNSYMFVFPGIGHSVIVSDPCADSMVTAFLDNPAQKPDASCIDTIHIQFITR